MSRRILSAPLSPGFRVTLNSRYSFGAVSYQVHRYFDMPHLDLRLVRALAESGCVSLMFPLHQLVISRERVCELDVSSTSACDYLQMCCPQFLNGGLHLDFEVLQWLKLIEIRKTQNETKKTTPNRTFEF